MYVASTFDASSSPIMVLLSMAISRRVTQPSRSSTYTSQLGIYQFSSLQPCNTPQKAMSESRHGSVSSDNTRSIRQGSPMCPGRGNQGKSLCSPATPSKRIGLSHSSATSSRTLILCGLGEDTLQDPRTSAAICQNRSQHGTIRWKAGG